MNNILSLDNNLTYYGIIGCGFILGCTLYYLIKSNNTPIPSKDIEAIIDSESDTDTASDYQSTTDTESTLDIDIGELDLYFMPNVDFDVCSIQELKHFELSSIFAQELIEHDINSDELMELICMFTKEQLMTNSINDFIY